ncbi:MAG TPA: hypothetical protein VH227_00010 [Candidatus Udaeobacter sp.]|nr:hypothetical protein [Candidatus Udaeobacter sp.]
MNALTAIPINRARYLAMVIGVISIIVCAVGFIFDRRAAFVSYLFGFLVWLGVALGSSGFLMIHHLTGGNWGYPVRRFFEAAIRTMPVLAALFVPILFGLPQLYPWANEANLSVDKILQHRQAYMNAPGFIIRAAMLFAVWIAGARLLCKWSTEQDATRSFEPTIKLRKLSGPGLVIYPLTMTFACVDWVMSMEADWYSTIFPLLVCVGQMLSALAFIIILVGWLGPRTALHEIISKESFHHLGNILLTFTMTWAYLAYSQLIVIWSGDLPHEISWYLHRIADGWRWIAIVLLLFHFFGPFFLLLFRQTKRNPQALIAIAAVVFVTHIVDVWWLVAPSLYQNGFYVSWVAPAALIGIGGIWLAVFLKNLETRPLVPLNDPRFAIAVST